jgi:tetratricopeptide (TPR) repeat protein
MIDGITAVYFNRGAAKFEFADYLGSIIDNTKALEIDPTEEGAWCNRGLAKIRIGQLAEAMADFLKALELCKDALEVLAEIEDD